MKKLLKQIEAVERLILEHKVKTISFDIDGTIYPIKKVQMKWWINFLKNPFRASRFYNIKKTWEGRRKGFESVIVTPSDIDFFEQYLTQDLLSSELVPSEMREWIKALTEREIKIFFLSDHGAEAKLKVLKVETKYAINCLKETTQLKPHAKISELLRTHYRIIPETHLHLGDRWTDEEQAKLFGCHFSYFAP